MRSDADPTGDKTECRHYDPAPRAVLSALDRLSKAALVDLVCDALEVSGDGDGMTVESAAEFCNPRLTIRGDRLIDLAQGSCTRGDQPGSGVGQVGPRSVYDAENDPVDGEPVDDAENDPVDGEPVDDAEIPMLVVAPDRVEW